MTHARDDHPPQGATAWRDGLASAALIALAVVSWIDVATFPLVLLLLAAPWLWLGHRVRPVALLLLLATPWVLLPSLAVFRGVEDYHSGRAGAWERGRGLWGHTNLDPHTRTYPRGAGGWVPALGLTFLAEWPNELVIRALSTVFGPPTGAYTGPYPLADEVALLLDVDPLMVVQRETEPDRVYEVGPHTLVVRPEVWSELHATDARLAAVEAGTPAPRWAALAGCDGPRPVAVVYALDRGEPFVAYGGPELPGTLGAALGCGA